MNARRVGRGYFWLGTILMCIGALAAGFMQAQLAVLENATIHNTAEFTAQIERIERNPTRLFTDNHPAPLVFLAGLEINWDYVTELAADDIITYRILQSQVRFTDSAENSIALTYLRVGERTIISLEQYNEMASAARQRTWVVNGSITATIGGLGFFFIIRAASKRHKFIRQQSIGSN